MHAKRTIPPIKNCDAVKLLHCTDHCLLVRFIAAMNDDATAKHWATHVESVKGANIAAGLANGGAQPTKGAWDVVELTVKCD
jgi:hypothetical protein